MKIEDVNILIAGDLHCPFDLAEEKKGLSYLKFLKNVYKKFECSKVIFIGDVIDNHFSSYHETSADGMGGADELNVAVKRLQKYYKAFPEAVVIIGNHDRMIMRKAQTSAIPSKWIKSYKEVLEVPKWEFTERYVFNDIQFIHGEGGQASTKARADMMNTVSGHYHTLAYTQHFVGAKYRVFGMQVGCGIDFKTYAMAYAKYGKKPAIGCGVILNGKTPLNILMEL